MDEHSLEILEILSVYVLLKKKYFTLPYCVKKVVFKFIIPKKDLLFPVT